MTLVRVVERADGGISIIRPVRKRRPGADGRAHYDALFGQATRNDPTLQGRPYVDIDDRELPTDREHRDSWRLVDGKVVVADPRTPESESPSHERRR